MTHASFERRPEETVISILIALVALGVVISLLRWASGGGFPPMDGSMMAGAVSAFGIVMMVFLGLAVAGLIIWVLFSMTAMSRSAPWGGPKDWSTFGAVSELKKRYARGMVSREEYMRTLQDLEGTPPAPAPPSTPPPPPPAAPMQGPFARQL